jgi:transposase
VGKSEHSSQLIGVRDLRKEARDLKEVVAEQMLEMRLLKKSMVGDGGEDE